MCGTWIGMDGELDNLEEVADQHWRMYERVLNNEGMDCQQQ